ncbi:putative M18 family aminopeptidase 2 [Planctomycetota bacterium]|nr:putative M18 family aminopeptidase 2 [Planctomycetota bacterium]
MPDVPADLVADLSSFLDSAPAPYLAGEAVVRRLVASGFRELALSAPTWPAESGGWFVRRGAAVIAWMSRSGQPRRLRAVGAHVDSPHLRLKPRAAYACEGCLQLGVEVYGGALHNSWLDRDLGVAGTVVGRDGRVRSVDLRRPLARVAQLAIHLDRKVTDDGLKLNAQQHLAPIWGLARAGEDADGALRAVLADAAKLPQDELLTWDLSLYDLAPAARLGRDGEFLVSGRLDNQVSCWAGLTALIGSGGGEAGLLPVLACFDHEEVGSGSDAGADGALFGQTLERIALTAGLDRAAYLALLSSGLLLSADMAHAVHPNYADRHEPRHRPRLGGGPVLKTNHNQRYATTAATAAEVHRLAARCGTTVQDFVARSDLGCGSTIGPATAAALGLAVADLGAPMLSMHSARELMAVADIEPYQRLLAAHFAG